MGLARGETLMRRGKLTDSTQGKWYPLAIGVPRVSISAHHLTPTLVESDDRKQGQP